MDWERVSKLLSEDLDEHIIKTRTGGGGKKLSYIDHFAAIDTANRIFGHGGWSRHTVLMRQVSDKPVAYMAKVRVTVGEVVRDGFGYGADPTARNDHEKAFKEAETDATKRALMTFGYPLGLALYQKEGEREHVSSVQSNPGGDELVPPMLATGITPHKFKNLPGEPSSAQSHRGLAMLKEDMMKAKSYASVTKWWFDHKEEIKQLNTDTMWGFFEDMIHLGLEKCQNNNSIGMFWNSHQEALKILNKADRHSFEDLEARMVERRGKVMGAETVEIFTPLDAG